MESYLKKDIRFVKGVGEKRAQLFEKLGVSSVGDLLGLFPRRMEDRRIMKPITSLADGETVGVTAVVCAMPAEKRIRKNMTVYTMAVRDGSGVMHMVWYNTTYVKTAFRVGETYCFYGQVKRGYGKWEMLSPLYEKPDEKKAIGRLVPIYPLTEGLSQKIVSQTIKACLEEMPDTVVDPIPKSVREAYGLAERNYALRQIHFPDDEWCYEAARKRLLFQEFFYLRLAVGFRRHGLSQEKGLAFSCRDPRPFFEVLPFAMTNAQMRVLREIAKDLTDKRPMARLVQGDVGSGKTAVAAAAMYMAVKSGYQAVLMAPTEILAKQHYETLSGWYASLGLTVSILTGSTTAAKKRKILEELKDGKIDVIVGTHALIEENVVFHALGLAITDEQHRFGVKQRARLAEKGSAPHVLVMTATPIPRTLSLTLYGDLDVSVTDELPPGRKKVDTYAVTESMRQRIYRFLRQGLEQGFQAYVVCPLVEESEALDLKAATILSAQMQETFPDFSVSLIHGKMKAKEKEAVMAAFAAGDIHILVSTTVIEVGVNVPNACYMIVENAERFGLSQLHQLRGRVGRGGDKAYCILFSDATGKTAEERAKIMTQSNDGFYIAEKDLELRGPGEYFGTRQHGVPSYQMTELLSDVKLLKQAADAADAYLEEDPLLEKEQNRALQQVVAEKIEENKTTMN
ncbi:MAG: ATP-dependent DNA helicase RecG [Clostridia bacterium]|nr:ATP-dependent DNA helicase RecG [Clostridia bacterium]